MLIINAIIRKELGKSASRKFRLLNQCPAVIYGHCQDNVFILLNYNVVSNIHDLSFWYNQALILILNNNKNTVRIQNIQYHPYKRRILHIDFLRIQYTK